MVHEFGKLDVPVTVSPFALTDLPVSGEGRILVRSEAARKLSEPEHQITASFGEVGELIGWAVEPKEIIFDYPLTSVCCQVWRSWV